MKSLGKMKQDDQRPKNKLKSGKKIKGYIAAGVVAAIVIGIIVAIEMKPIQLEKSQSNNGVMVMHIHSHISLIIDGKPTVVPANIGIDQTIWNNHSLDSYGMTGMAPLHTHKDDGIIHVESKVKRDYTLGEFLNIWGLDLRGYQVNVTIDGNPVSDYRNQILNDGESIVINLTSNH